MIDSHKFLSSKLDSLVKTLDNDDFKFLKREFPDKRDYLDKTLAYPYEHFDNIDDYQNPLDNLKKENFFSKLKFDYARRKKQSEQKSLLKN